MVLWNDDLVLGRRNKKVMGVVYGIHDAMKQILPKCNESSKMLLWVQIISSDVENKYAVTGDTTFNTGCAQF